MKQTKETIPSVGEDEKEPDAYILLVALKNGITTLENNLLSFSKS